MLLSHGVVLPSLMYLFYSDIFIWKLQTFILVVDVQWSLPSADTSTSKRKGQVSLLHSEDHGDDRTRIGENRAFSHRSVL